MGFALQLQDSLRTRHGQVADEFAAGETLEAVLVRHLLAVEAAADTELLTSVLLLDESGTRVLHGAAPNLPKSFCEAIHESEIGPAAGSCGTAAYFGRPIYVTDIASDPLWDNYRHLALPHGLRACWSTPIHDAEGKVLGTFAIYHLTARSPTPGEVESIRLITDHVAQAILWGRSDGAECLQADQEHIAARGNLRLVSGGDSATGANGGAGAEAIDAAGRLHGYASKLDRFAEQVASPRFAATLKAAADDCRKLGDTVQNRQTDRNDER